MSERHLQENYLRREKKSCDDSPQPYRLIDDEGVPLDSTISIKLPNKSLIVMYELMAKTRVFDEKGLKLQRQGRVNFYLSSTGSEASQIGSAFALSKEDWICPYYRQQGVLIQRGLDLKTMAANWFGNQDDIAMGRQMPIHYSSKKHNILSISSPIGTQLPDAVGIAMAAQIKQDPIVVATYFGDGASSSNGFHAALNLAGVRKAPIIFIGINNQYAISTPLEKQTASESIAIKGIAYGIEGKIVDGNDILAVYDITKQAVKHAKAGKGPLIIECYTYRLSPHSSSDDPSRYRDGAEEDIWKNKDPIVRFRKYLEYRGIWDEEKEEALWSNLTNEVNKAIEETINTPLPAWETLFEDVYETIPLHLANQRDKLFMEEKGMKIDFQGEFPL